MKKLKGKIDMTKKLLSLMLVFLFAFTTQVSALAEGLEVTVFVDNVQLEFDVNPIIENGRTLVPMRYIFEALGAQVDWIDETQTAVATKGEIKIEITVDSTEMKRNGEIITLDVPAKLLNDRTLVPVRAVSEGLGANVDWDEELFRVIITSDSEDLEEKEVYSSAETNTAANEYPYTELSKNDMELLKSFYSDYRYSFEQSMICMYIDNVSKEIVSWAPVFKSEVPELQADITNIWQSGLIELIMQIQLKSESTYVFENISEESLTQAYNGILEKAGMSASQMFETSYKKTPGGTTVLLIEFKETNTDIACKYAAIVPDSQTARYFTAETSTIAEELGQGGYFLCEVKTDGRNNYSAISKTEKDFLAGIDKVLKK